MYVANFMQAFYPPTLKHRLSLAALLLLVVLLHMAGLHSLAGLWPTQTTPPARVNLQWQAAPAAASSSAAAAPAPVRQPSKPKTANSAPASGFQAASPRTEDMTAEPVQTTEPETAKAEDLPEPATDSPAAASAGPADAPLPAQEPVQAAAPLEPAAAVEPVPAPADSVSSTPAPAVTDNGGAPAWLSQARFVWPRPGTFQYDVIGESKGIRFNANGELVWLHDGVNYQMKLDISHMLLGSRSQTSVGTLGNQGLQPKRFGDKYKQEVAAHFERDKGLVVFSASSNPQALQAAAQDRLSLFAQLAALLAGSPELRQSGQLISFQVVAAKSADIWTFQVDKQETLQLPVGSLSTWKVSRVFKGSHDQTADVWLSPAHGYLPVKVRIVQSNGDLLEQNLRKVVGQ